MTDDGFLVYGTCVCLAEKGAILLGPSGSGKSDLALRFILNTPDALAPALVSDDQIEIVKRGGKLIASPPKTIAGRIEVRGLGILDLAYREEAEVRLVVRLVDRQDVPRMPPDPPPVHTLCDTDLPRLDLAPFEASADLKLRLALQSSLL